MHTGLHGHYVKYKRNVRRSRRGRKIKMKDPHPTPKPSLCSAIHIPMVINFLKVLHHFPPMSQHPNKSYTASTLRE